MGGPGLVIICSLPRAKPSARGVDMWCGAHFLSSSPQNRRQMFTQMAWEAESLALELRYLTGWGSHGDSYTDLNAKL